MKSPGVRARHPHLFRSLTAIALLIGGIALWLMWQPRVTAAPAAPKHGLTGSYYIHDVPVEEPFGLPVLVSNAEATRTDAQIAFGQGRGFASDSPDNVAPWADLPEFAHMQHREEWLRAVMWRGYIHLPKAGTYYFTTASHGPSAVYLNNTRVALNGPGAVYGALMGSDAFTYDQNDIADFLKNVKGTPFYQRVQDSYIVPVTVDAARDLPIEVRYGTTRGVIGIDLFWVTPDSPKDQSGKPLAKLVPSDALYTEAPSTIAEPPVRSATSTLSLDSYCTGLTDAQPLTVTFRLADKNGQPVAGKRVYFNTLSNDKFGYNELTQPDKPTDENGITTGKLRAKPGESRTHTSTIYAVDATDLVELGQVATVRFPEVPDNFFASPCVSSYDSRGLAVDPQPMVVGRPHTVSVKLQNRQSTDVELNAIFEATNFNIGAMSWSEIGRVENIRLKPGETRDVSIQWTPSHEQMHQCFRVRLRRRNQNAGTAPARVNVAAALLPSVTAAWFDKDAGFFDVGSISHNYGPIVPEPPNPCTEFFTYGWDDDFVNKYWIPEPPGADWGSFPDPTHMDMRAKVYREAADRTNDPDKKHVWNVMADCFAFGASAGPDWSWTDSDQIKVNARGLASDSRDDGNDARRSIANCPPGNADCIADALYRQYADGQNSDLYDRIAKDPPTLQYRGLAVAKDDSPGSYIDAIRVSLERFKGARDNGDREWMNRHLTALRLYSAKLADALEQKAGEMQKRADALPPDDAAKLKATHDTVIAALRRNEPLPAEQIDALRKSGMSDAQIKGLQADILAHATYPIEGPRAGVLHTAQYFRGQAKFWRSLSVNSSNQNTGVHSRAALGFTLSNPHDKTEDIRLFVQPMALPSSWRVSVINAEQLGSKPGGNQPQPEFPVREVHPGQEYYVTLPPGKQVQVASVVVPQGELGAGTMARWAVEGRIGDEVIGSMVSEYYVPAVVPDMKLPPVGSAEVFEEPATAAPAVQAVAKQFPWLWIVIAIVAVLVIILLVVAMRKRRSGP